VDGGLHRELAAAMELENGIVEHGKPPSRRALRETFAARG